MLLFNQQQYWAGLVTRKRHSDWLDAELHHCCNSDTQLVSDQSCLSSFPPADSTVPTRSHGPLKASAVFRLENCERWTIKLHKNAFTHTLYIYAYHRNIKIIYQIVILTTCRTKSQKILYKFTVVLCWMPHCLFVPHHSQPDHTIKLWGWIKNTFNWHRNTEKLISKS